MLYRRSVCVMYLTATLALPILITGCTSKEEKMRAEMRRKIGEIPEKYRNDGAPQVGDTALLFKLKTVEGDRTVDLASFVNDRPVVLFFGSYT